MLAQRLLNRPHAYGRHNKGRVMSRWGLLAILGALASPAAFAADMPGTLAPPPAPPLLTPVLSPRTGRWSLPGDVGYFWGRVDAAPSLPSFLHPAVNDPVKGITGGVDGGFNPTCVETEAT